LIGLGLNKIRRIASVPDTPASWGMIRKVRHLIRFPDEHLFEDYRLARPQPIDEAADIERVCKLVFDPRGIVLHKFGRKEKRKNPDFKLYKDGNLIGYCEVKSPRDDWVFDFPEDLQPGEHRVELRRDPAAVNLADHVGKAAAQFRPKGVPTRVSSDPTLCELCCPGSKAQFPDILQYIPKGGFRGAAHGSICIQEGQPSSRICATRLPL